MNTIQENKYEKKFQKQVDPDQRLVTERQAINLAVLAKVDASELAGKTIAAVNALLKWKIAPELLLFQRVCGRVVKRDPATGELHPVPNATVHVEDTNCTFLGFSPVESIWMWFFPVFCTREEITAVTTDECGRFCVYIPRWDIDMILRLRRTRICFPDIVKPRIRDILEKINLLPDPPIIHDPRPQPDPLPFTMAQPDAFEQVKEVFGQEVAEQIELFSASRMFGDSTLQSDDLLDMPAFTQKFPPPLPDEFRNIHSSKCVEALAARISISDRKLKGLDFSNFIGPFLRCRDVIVPEWVPIFDIPDITFKVTQDVNNDGTEETIYSEGFFDVRWNDTSIPDVTLVASGNALATPNCKGPEIDVEGCEKPTILTAGLMPLEPAYHNSSIGYALRPNRSRRLPPPNAAHGFWDSPQNGDAEAPYLRTLQFHGCHRFGSAEYYRMLYAYEGASEVPFTGLIWNAPRFGGGVPIPFIPDTNGWYEIVPAADLVFPYWLLNWDTRRDPDGRYVVRLQVANASKTVIDQSDPVAFMIDNSRPNTSFTQIRWRVPGITGWNVLSAICPVIRRPKDANIELEVTYSASTAHFRDVILSAYGCGGGSFDRKGDMLVPSDRGKFEHWHIMPSDNSWGNTATFELPGTSLEGSYTVVIYARGRGFNPAGSDAGPGTDWNYDPVYSWSYPRRHIAIINESP